MYVLGLVGCFAFLVGENIALTPALRHIGVWQELHLTLVSENCNIPTKV